jgi:O-antigen/teichoic acid export membrane protein
MILSGWLIALVLCSLGEAITSMQYRRVPIFLGANILSAAIPFLLLPLLTRVLTPADYGTVAMFGVFLAVFASIAGLSVHGAVGIRYFELSKERLAQFIGACFVLLLTSTAVTACLVFVGGYWWRSVWGVPIGWIVVAALTAGMQFVISTCLALWQSSGNVVSYGILQIGQSIFNIGLTLVFVLYLGMNWEGRALGQAMAIFAFGLLCFFLLYRSGHIAFPADDKGDYSYALNFGVPLVPHALGGMLIIFGGRFIVVTLGSEHDVGIYMVPLQFVLGLSLIFDAINKVFHPYLLQMAKDQVDKRKVVRTVYKIMGANFLISLCAGISIYFLYPLIVGKAFISGRELIWVLVLAAFIQSIYYLTAIFINIANRNSYLARNTFFSGCIGMTATWFLVGKYGLTGAALGYLLTEVISTSLNWHSSNKVYPLPWLMFE